MEELNLTELLKCGDRIHCTDNGNGYVEKIYLNSSYPIVCRFDTGGFSYYTKEGKQYNDENDKVLLSKI